MKTSASPRITFITGTDTGVGKSVLSALLLQHWRQSGCNALGLKPFCSGGWGDTRLMRLAQDKALPLEQITPFYFPEPVTPLVSMRRHRRAIPLVAVLKHIRATGAGAERLLIEGAGGLLAPLGEDYCALDLIQALRCEAVVAARNKLGTINHTLLTVRALRQAGVRKLTVVLLGVGKQDASQKTNAELLKEQLKGIPLVEIPYLGASCKRLERIKGAARQLGKRLAQM